MVDEAHGEVKIALQELRDLARGDPPGDPHRPRARPGALRPGRALHGAGDRDRRPAHRAPPAIEGITYFTVSELLQNISKHARATSARIDVWHTADRLMLQVTDNGQGGANPARRQRPGRPRRAARRRRRPAGHGLPARRTDLRHRRTALAGLTAPAAARRRVGA